MIAHAYGQAINNIATKQINLNTDSLKVMLCSSAYTPAQNTHSKKSDITGEVTGAGYTAGGAVIANTAATYANGVVTLDGDDVTWADSTITARYAIVYDDTSTNDLLICYFDFESDESSSAGPFKLQWNASGIITLKEAA